MIAGKPPDATIAQVQSSSLPMLVQKELERMILTGELAVGAKLNEVALAERERRMSAAASLESQAELAPAAASGTDEHAESTWVAVPMETPGSAATSTRPVTPRGSSRRSD